ncbi:uncharacterized protein B0H64DRAFT_386780 [Chaetomium fimeti]|uniref:Nuclear pore assembly and biogenesis-domain-containing protein n=1 Tax=Chaetomium fimeti TaxID=1854472 RepID=A0AAE0LVL3_9PEZI|nr:hypothetical protein B0H64DRAFT_386780 [Chaetomium fimeti]
MDDSLPWTLSMLTDILPPETLTYLAQLQTTLLSPTGPLQTLRDALAHLTAMLTPLFTAAIDRLVTLLSASPNVVAAAVLVVLAIVILQILSLVRRVVLFWTRVAFRLVFWAGVALVVSWAWQRGMERSLRDAAVVGGKAAGWLAGAGQAWWQEYEKAQLAQQQGKVPGHGGL